MRAFWSCGVALALLCGSSMAADGLQVEVTPIPSPVKQRLAAIAAANAAKSEIASRVYEIHCRVVERTDDGTENVLSRPGIMTLEGQSATVQVGQVTPIVAGLQPVAGGNKPLVVMLQSGLKATVTVMSEQPGYVILDASIESSAVDPAAVKDNGDGTQRASGRVRTQGLRTVERIALDKPLTLGIDNSDAKKSKRLIEMVVSEKSRK
jgi:hypothetical protein